MKSTNAFFPWVHSHTRSILFLLTVLALGGLASSLLLPVALFPQVDFPRLALSVDAGDRPAERMAIEVTRPIEESLRAIPGVRGIRSTTSRGTADVFLDFDWGHDMTVALLQAESQVNKVLPTLPTGTTFEIERRDPTVFPVIAYSLRSDTRSLIQLRDLAQYELRPVLTTVEGVSRVNVQGGAVEEYRVVVDPGKLQAMKLTLAELSASLSASNVLTAVGRLEDHYKLYLVISDTRFQSVAQIGDTVLRSGANGLVRLSDVATVRKDTAPNYTRVTADGHDAVLFQVYAQPGANTVQIAKQIKSKLEGMRDKIPNDVKLANWYDQSDLIIASASSVRDAVVAGVVLAAIILLLFLRNWKVTLIATLAVPVVLAMTVLLLYSLGMSFNIMTLGGMAAAVGLIVDDAIVMVEHIVRRLRGGAAGWGDRILAATDEFTRPLAGSSASTIIIFAPLAFLTGVTGAFFKALSLTMAASLVLSFLVAWLGVPVLAARMLGQKDADQREGGAVTDRLARGYSKMMGAILPRPWVVLLILAPLLAGGYLAYRAVGSGFMPSMDEGGFILDYLAPPGTSVTETDRLLRQLESILRSVPEVETYSRRTGLQLGGGLTESNQGDFFIRLKPQPRRAIDQVMEDVRKQVEHAVPGLEIETAQLMEDLIGDLTAVPQPIEVKLFSDDEKALEDVANAVQSAIQKVPGVVEVKNGIFPAGDALNIRVDRSKAALEGMDVDDITKTMANALSGTVTTEIQEGPKLVGIRVWTPKTERATVQDVGELMLRAPNGHVFPLKRVAEISAVIGQPQIVRENLQRMRAVTGRIEGRDLGSTANDVKAVLARPGLLPKGMSYALGGLYEQQQIAFRGLLIVLISAVLLVFVLLLFLFERFKVALAMMLTTLVATAAVFAGLWVTHTELNITAIMGMTMVVGIVTEVAIFYYSEFEVLAHDSEGYTRFIAAGVNRMRPIAMTTFAAILALLPLALGIGQGSAMQQPLAIAIISGLIVQLPLVLIVLPAFVVMFKSDH